MTLLVFPRMADLELFRQHHTTISQATLYRKWADANPREAKRYEAYAAAVLDGTPADPPTLATATGRALVLAAQMGANG